MIRKLLFLLFFSTYSSNAQDRIEIKFNSHELAEMYEIETLRFYISNIELYASNGTHYKEENSYHLVDLEDPDSWTIYYPNAKFNEGFDSISFLIGTDSLTNVAGILDGDLDPIKGMYWAWNSGYIHFKVAGKKLTSNTQFEYHLGGYLPPYATARKLTFPINVNEIIHVKLNLAQFLDQIDMQELNEVLIPGAAAVQLSNQLSNCFSIE